MLPFHCLYGYMVQMKNVIPDSCHSALAKTDEVLSIFSERYSKIFNSFTFWLDIFYSH